VGAASSIPANLKAAVGDGRANGIRMRSAYDSSQGHERQPVAFNLPHVHRHNGRMRRQIRQDGSSPPG
jgi:hypothetical protein